MNDSKKPDDAVLPFALKPEDFESAADSVRLPRLDKSTPVNRPPIVTKDDTTAAPVPKEERTILMAVAPPPTGNKKPT